MSRNISALFWGFIFGLGLAISGMVNPAKVIGFLDVTGPWDPTLGVVFFYGAGCRSDRVPFRAPLSGPTL